MLSDLRFSETVYGLGAGIFFLGYFLLESPSNIILHRVGACLWIARVMLTWAVISAAMLFVTSATGFYILRFLLGVAEAGFFPGVILYLTYWYPSDRRAAIIALFMTGIPVAGVIGGPISGWILKAMAGVHGLAGWQWLFLLEALPSLVLGVAVLAYLDDGIARARWLAADEKEILAGRIAADQQHAATHALWESFTKPQVWFLGVIYFCLIAGLYGAGFWLPTLIRRTGVESPLAIGPHGSAQRRRCGRDGHDQPPVGPDARAAVAPRHSRIGWSRWLARDGPLRSRHGHRAVRDVSRDGRRDDLARAVLVPAHRHSRRGGRCDGNCPHQLDRQSRRVCRPMADRLARRSHGVHRLRRLRAGGRHGRRQPAGPDDPRADRQPLDRHRHL